MSYRQPFIFPPYEDPAAYRALHAPRIENENKEYFAQLQREADDYDRRLVQGQKELDRDDLLKAGKNQLPPSNMTPGDYFRAVGRSVLGRPSFGKGGRHSNKKSKKSTRRRNKKGKKGTRRH